MFGGVTIFPILVECGNQVAGNNLEKNLRWMPINLLRKDLLWVFEAFLWHSNLCLKFLYVEPIVVCMRQRQLLRKQSHPRGSES
ncbi:hypothetical protein HanRHA438_Chr00c07g0846651 [Helianthus annuus]|nr:hypothetical protein HanRHA438_Chr00c07g0846651 [Helianthus annuus]